MKKLEDFHIGCSCCTPTPLSKFGRRDVLAGLGLGAVAAVAAGRAFAAETEGPAKPPFMKGQIDIHHHIVPPAMYTVLEGGPNWKETLQPWTPQINIERMDKIGTQTAITSFPSPPKWPGTPEAVKKMVTETNEYQAKLVSDYKGRLGGFCLLSLPNIDATLKDIEYAFDTLKCDGAFMWTNYGDIWVGDRSFDPVYEELNRRKATVFVHVRSANCCTKLNDSLGDGTVEWQTDTTRAIGNTIFGGAQLKYPNINWIWAHGGGTMPYLVRRFIGVGEQPKNKASVTPEGFLVAARKFYYDCAQQQLKAQLYPLKDVVTAERMIFGTDAPYEIGLDLMGDIAKTGFFTKAELHTISRGNAEKLFPRFKV